MGPFSNFTALHSCSVAPRQQEIKMGPVICGSIQVGFRETLAIPFMCVCWVPSRKLWKPMAAVHTSYCTQCPTPCSIRCIAQHWDHRRVDPVANANQGQQRTPGMAKQRKQQLGGSGVLDLSMCWVVGC